MKRVRQFIRILGSLLMPFVFSLVCFAMDFDAEEMYESVFVIHSGNYEGSGFALGSNTVITNAHVIGNRNSIKISTYSGENFEAVIYLYNEALDIAVLSVAGAEFVPLKVGDCGKIKIGDDIYAVGVPKNMEYTLTKGIISNKSRTIGFHHYIQIDAAINSGNSGGPLLNNSGQVIGVNSMKLSDAEGIGLAIPISDVVNFMEGNDMELTEDKNVQGEIEYVRPQEEKGGSSGRVVIRKEPDYTLAIIVGVLLGISVILNIVLLALLGYRKNKDIVVPTDFRDRTDFEIDIWE